MIEIIKDKKEIIAKHENAIHVSNIGIKYGVTKSTICTILKNKKMVKIDAININN